jgi:ATP/maltotriose-dependent transcriptional regulator MalT
MNSQSTQTDASPFLFARIKLRPPRLRSDTLPRPRLVETIRQAIGNVRLALVSAPAGYGKTTLVANAVNGLAGVQVVWVTLNSEDNEPLRFLHLLIQAQQCDWFHRAR